MKKTAIVLAIITLIASFVLPVNAENSGMAFNDVPHGVWYAEPVSFVSGHGIMTGTAPAQFSPDKPLTREEFVFIYVKAYVELLGKTTIPHYDKTSFSDVKPGMWYSDYVEYAYQSGIVSGVGNGEFGVGMNIKREDVAVIFFHKSNSVSDVEITLDYWGCKITDTDKVSAYARSAVTRACSYESVTYHYVDPHQELNDPLFVGNEKNEFMPQKNMTRAELATVLRSRLEKYASSFSDNA